MTIYINNDLQVKIMLQFSVTLEEIKDEGFDIVAAALFDDVERKYTTDWGVTGPIIQDLGVSLNYQGADKGLKLFSRNSSERDFDWMASYGDATEFSHSPLLLPSRLLLVNVLATYRYSFRTLMLVTTLLMSGQLSVNYLKVPIVMRWRRMNVLIFIFLNRNLVKMKKRCFKI